MKWALGISLALNLLILGAVGGALLRSAGVGPDMRPARGGPLLHGYGAPYMRALPAEARQAVRADVPGLPSRRERRAHFGEMLDALRADQFDPTTVSVLFERQRETALLVQSVLQDRWLTVVSEMSDAERADLADRLEEMMNRNSDRMPAPLR
ncbi:MAG: periplasmic heavy metal sensor [Pseudomonadota bacterium]